MKEVMIMMVVLVMVAQNRVVVINIDSLGVRGVTLGLLRGLYGSRGLVGDMGVDDAILGWLWLDYKQIVAVTSTVVN